MAQKYKNFISLGYFCEVAQDLEELGLRNVSSPFDWEISEFRGVIKAIDKRFDRFMNYDDLYQSERYGEHYFDKNYGIWFFHDFNKWDSLKAQYPAVHEKYERRAKRFLNNITEPTLFFRYIQNQDNMYDEISWLNENYDYVLSVLRRYNPQNDIVFIGDYETNSDKFKIYHVMPDENDLVSRHPIIHNQELYELVKTYYVPNQDGNVQRFQKKQQRKRSVLYRGVTRLYEESERHFLNRIFMISGCLD